MANWKFELKNKFTGAEYEFIGIDNYKAFIKEVTENFNADWGTDYKPSYIEAVPSTVGFDCKAHMIQGV